MTVCRLEACETQVGKPALQAKQPTKSGGGNAAVQLRGQVRSQVQLGNEQSLKWAMGRSRCIESFAHFRDRLLLDMRKPSMLTVIAFVLVAAVAVAFIKWPSEPSFNGRSLSRWVSYFETPIPFACTDDAGEARIAIQKLGTNATPYLIEWLAYKQPPWKSNLLRHANAFGKRVGITNRFSDGKLTKADKAGRALLQVPMLSAEHAAKLGVLSIDDNEGVSSRAMWALKSAGGLPLDALIIMMTNSSARVRKLAIIDLGQKTNIHLAANSLLDRLKDDSSAVAMWAAIRLGDVPNSPPSTVLALVKALGHPAAEVRAAAACALGNHGKRSSMALPALRRMREDPDPSVRNSIAMALNYIDPPPIENAEVASP